MVRNPHNRYLYERARFLRGRGLAYNDIQRELKTSKSNISLWCRDVILSKAQKDKLFIRSRKMILGQFGALANKKRRAEEVAVIRKEAKKEIKRMDYNALKIAGAMLYWAEGTKKKSTAITNSDPRVIQLSISWFKKVFDIGPERLNAHLHIHYGNDERKIKKYWAGLTGIPLGNFGKSFIKPKGTGHRTNILPNGIIRIRVMGIGTENLRHRILAWTEKIYQLAVT